MTEKISIGLILLHLMKSHMLREVIDNYDPNDVIVSGELLLRNEKNTNSTTNVTRPILEEYATTEALNVTNLDDNLHFNLSTNKISLRSFVTYKSLLWPRAVVPYVIDPHFDWWQHKKIGKAFKLFHQVSCVRFVPRTNQRDYIFFQWFPDARCASVLGREGGMQQIALKDDCINNPLYKGLLVHELMHALGFIHEHQRSDRDCYLHASGPQSESVDFQIIMYTDTRFPYDYRSIMHYRERDWFYAKNGEQIGNRAGTLTSLDKDKLNYVYCGGPHYCDLHPRHCQATTLSERSCRATVGYKPYEEEYYDTSI